MRLHGYQSDARAFLVATADVLHGALLHDDMGVGKTAAAIACIPDGAPVLLVVPAALKLKWRDDLAAWRPEMRVAVLEGQTGFRWPRPGEAVIANLEILPPAKAEIVKVQRAIAEAETAGASSTPLLDVQRRADDVGKLRRKLEDLTRRRSGIAAATPPDNVVAIVDEAHETSSNKSAQTQRWRALRRELVKRGGRAYAVTATVALNAPLELWGLLTSFGLHTAAFGDWWGFLDAWSGWKAPWGVIEWREPKDAKVAAALRKVGIRRLFDDVVTNVPPLLPWDVQRVTLHGDGARRVDDVESEARARGLDLWRATPEELDGVESLRRGKGKVAFEMMSRVKAALAEAKIPFVRATAAAAGSGGPVVVASSSLAPVEAFDVLAGWRTITGAEIHERRHDTVAAFKRQRLEGVAFTTRSGGVGIDLFVAAAAERGLTLAPFISADRDWVRAWNRQALARVRRQGQTVPTRPILIRADHPLEDRLDEVLQGKARLARAVDAAALRPERSSTA